MSVVTLPICACGCGEALPPPVRKGGRPRRYVNEAHKARAKRRRHAGPTWGGDAAASTLGTDPATRQRKTLQALADMLEGEAHGSAEEQLTRVLIEATQLLFTLRSLSCRLHAQLGARADQLALGLEDALRRSFGEVL